MSNSIVLQEINSKDKFLNWYVFKNSISYLDDDDLSRIRRFVIFFSVDNDWLKKILSKIVDYDFIFIDCPPALGLLTINGLVASKSVIIPLQCEFFALEGLSALTNTIDTIKSGLNSNIDLEGVVLTMFDKRNALSSLVEEDVRSHFKNKVYKTVIPRNVRISEAPSHGKPVLLYDTQCAGSQAYIGLAKEVILNQ